MPTFYYTAKSFEGETRTGVLEAQTKEEVARSLRKEGFLVTRLTTKNPLQKRTIAIPFLDVLFGISTQEKWVFTKNLRLMLRAGVGIGRAIRTLASQAKNKNFQKILLKVEDSVSRGRPLADSFAEHGRVFQEFFISMVKVGEESGTLDESLLLLANQLEKEHTLRSKVRGAMVYPVVIITVMVGVGILMMLLVVPKLENIFVELKLDLPLTTRMIIGISGFLRNFWFLIPVVFFAGMFFVRALHRSKRGRKFFDTLFLKFFIIGGIVRKVNTARSARTLGSLIASGVPIVRSLEIASATLGNIHFQKALSGATDQVRQGKSLYEYFLRYPDLYPPLVAQMIQVGEETGNLSEILGEIADFYEGEVDATTKNIASIVEPVLMVVVGVGVGFFAVSMIQPMYSMLSGI